jgi:Domain of unknown function (DUF4389)
VLFSGEYPRSLFDFNVGVLRWGWRVRYYGYEVLGTDRYPPFSLGEEPDYPARLHIEYRPRRPRWLPLVAWLFVIPHVLILAGLVGTSVALVRADNVVTNVPIGVITVGILVVGCTLLFRGRYPEGLFDLLVGVVRWSLRVSAYLALLTDEYPPFRLDQGWTEPDGEPSGPRPDGAWSAAHPVTPASNSPS